MYTVTLFVHVTITGEEETGVSLSTVLGTRRTLSHLPRDIYLPCLTYELEVYNKSLMSFFI